jgi:hypothetical protein
MTYLQWRDFAKQLLARIEREWWRVLVQTDFLVSMSQLHLAGFVRHHITLAIALSRIRNDAVMSRRDNDHWSWLQDNRLVVLHSESLRPSDDVGNIGVVIQDMNIMQRLESDNLED